MALGLVIGICIFILAAVSIDKFNLLEGLSGESYYTLLGASVAAIVGVFGQVLVIAADGWREHSREMRASKAIMHRILTNSFKHINIFLQLKEHSDSLDPHDYIRFTDRKPIIKPIFASDILLEFSMDEVVEAMRVKDMDFFTKLNEFNGIVTNYLKIYPVYSALFDAFCDPKRDGVKFDFDTGLAEVSSKIDDIEYFKLFDLQSSLIYISYKGVSHSIYIAESASRHLKEIHNEEYNFKIPLSSEDLLELRNSLD